MLYCCINLPLYSIQYLMRAWPFGYDFCYVSTAIRYFNAFADWMSLALIAFSRCISLTNPKLSDRLFTGGNGKYFILGTWAYALVLLCPAFTEVEQKVEL